MKKFKLGFVGLSHLGLNYIAASAKKNFECIGYSNDKKVIEELKNDKLSLSEPNLLKTIKKYKANLEFTNNLEDIKKCKLIYVSLDAETDKNNNVNLKKIKSLINILINILDKNSIIIVLSQVPPGFTSNLNWKKENLYYQVETLIFGKALDRALYPERIIIGCHNEKKISKFLKLYLSSFNSKIYYMDYKSAELAKISINMMLVSSVTTSNTISQLCENIGADWTKIIPVLRTDKRIGKYAYIKPGLGISGGNLERDMKTLIYLSKKNATNHKLIENFINHSNYQKDWVYRILRKEVLKNLKKPKISILGLAYKEDTNSIKNSPSLFLLNKLKKYKILVFDPVVKDIKNLKHIKFTKNKHIAYKNCNILIFMTPWKDFYNINPLLINKYLKNQYVIDPYNILNVNKLNNINFNYFTLGKGSYEKS